MDINKILAEYDGMFGRYDLTDIELFLKNHLQQAERENENNVRITLLNEIIGLCRDTSQREKALSYCMELKILMDSMGLNGTTDYATSLLNIANAYRAFGLLQEAAVFYEQVRNIYDNQLSTPGHLYASLYNNWSHVYQDNGDHFKAKELLEKALDILISGDYPQVMQAISRVNIATALLRLNSDTSYREAMDHLQKALSIFEADGGKDFHYSAALVAMGDACSYRNELQQALDYYGRGLQEIEKHTGKNKNYEITLAKYNDVKARISNRGILMNDNVQKKGMNLQRSREFYETYGRKMIHEEFPEYEHRIAVGLAGEGSDCFGFDDSISADHDYAPGFCMWLTAEDYEKIGAQLQQAYDRLIDQVYEYKQIDRFIKDRRGASTIGDFYTRILRRSRDYQNEGSFSYWEIPEDQLAAATNGEVFRDDLGIFTGVRKKLLGHYPQDILRRKLAQELHEFSQYAQSNYPRMMARGDQFTANLCIYKGAESVMNILYLLNGIYAPYYKWKRKGLENVPGASSVIRTLEEIAKTPAQTAAWANAVYSPVHINMADRVTALFEDAAKGILGLLKAKGFVSGDELFLEAHIAEILGAGSVTNMTAENPGESASAADASERKAVETGCDAAADEISPYKEFLIKNVMALEWKQFDKVHNEGGRASCQDDHETFKIMRLSQYMTWPEELLKSFYNDLKTAEEKGWNLITEKYARMMKNTDPVQYSRIEPELPALSEERKKLQEVIIGIQVSWMEAFAEKFPSISGGARSIHSYDDSTYNTSYETYLRGEISTYSNETFMLYADFIRNALSAGRNISREVMKNTTVLYGYRSLEDAEARQSGRR